ncbi:MAG: type VI secretion system protein TssA [Smithellaceae bacterium]
MMTISDKANWRFVAVGKHPAAKDFVKLGESVPVVNELSTLLETAYSALTSSSNTLPEFSSWRFWSKGSGKDSLICGMVRDSSDAMGRPYPFLIIGSGLLKDWEKQWDLLPFACENTWRQFEYLATHKFENIKQLEEELPNIRPPSGQWSEHIDKRKSLNQVGSPLDPFTSFLDFKILMKQVTDLSDKAECFVSLDRGPCNDKILQVSLWHHLLKMTMKGLPQTLFLGGTLEKAFLATYNRNLHPADAVHLWSLSSADLWENIIGTEYSMDISTLGKEPISVDRPGGADVRYDPDFQELQNEIDKLSSPSAEGSINWEKVMRFSSDILAHKSKDLLVAIYLAVALIYTRQYDGLSIGVKLLMDLMGKFWEQLYPSKERMRGRLRSMEWWVEKCGNALKQLSRVPVPEAQVNILKDNLDQIEQWMRQHLEGPPSLKVINDFVAAITVKDEAKVQKEIAKPQAANLITDTEDKEETVSPSTAVSLPDDIQPPQFAQRMFENHLQKMREITGSCWQQDPSNPMFYRLNRKSLWFNIEELPSSANRRTRISAPDNHIVKMLFDLRASGDAEVLLKAAEERLPQFIFWLDLNRFVAEALARLGARFTKAHRAVCQETAFLICQLPGLDDLSFADGMPFANPETRNWLNSILLDAPNATEPISAFKSNSAGNEDRIVREIAEAQCMIRKGKLFEAMEILQENLNAASSRREKILWRLAISQLLLDVKQVKLAMPHLDQIIREIDAFHLEDYDPSLALRGLKIVCVGWESQKDKSLKSKKADVLYRIAGIDMAEAIRMGKT